MSFEALKADIKFTYHDYLLLPEDKRYELIGGDLLVTPLPTTIHQLVSIRIGSFLNEHVQRNSLGVVLYAPMDVVLSEEEVVQPDILFISNERKGIIQSENIHGAPDLVIEILSPATAERDLVVKKKLYAKYGVLEYWIVNPKEKTIEVMTWSEKGFRTVQVYPAQASLRSSLLPDLTLPLNVVF